MAAWLTLWVLPVLITSLTPFTYNEVLGHTKDELCTLCRLVCWRLGVGYAISDLHLLRTRKPPRIGILDIRYYMAAVHDYLPHATLVVFKSVTEFFEQRGEEVDGFVYAAEASSAWTCSIPPTPSSFPSRVSWPFRSSTSWRVAIQIWSISSTQGSS